MKLSSSRSQIHIIVEIIGWLSVGLIIVAYAMISFGSVENSSLTYQLLNLIGAAGIVFHSIIKKDYQPAALNIVWALIAILAIASL